MGALIFRDWSDPELVQETDGLTLTRTHEYHSVPEGRRRVWCGVISYDPSYQSRLGANRATTTPRFAFPNGARS
jgi:hypothetical protein